MVKHVLKDGTAIDSIQGKKIKNETIYLLIREMEKENVGKIGCQ